MDIRCIIFDFDGTLADTAAGIVATQQEMLRRLGLPESSPEQMRAAIGLPLKECLRVGANVPDSMLESAAKLYREIFFDCASEFIEIFDGVRPTLEWLSDKGIEMAIATSRGRNSLGRILEAHGLTEFFKDWVTADDCIKPKPAPDLVLALLERMGRSSAETLVVGDTTFDIQMGKGAGCRTLGVSYGNHSPEMLATATPDWIAGDCRYIMDLLKGD